MRIRFASQSYRSQSLPVSAQRCRNMYAAIQPPDAKTDVAVFGCPGVVTWVTAGSGPIRGFSMLAGVLYAQSGGTLYRINDDETVTPVGSTVSGTGPVGMDENGTQLAIVNGVTGYIYSTAAGLQVISDGQFHPANTVSFIDSVFAFDRTGTNEFFISDSLDGTAYSDLFASAETKPDDVVAVANYLQTLLIMGERTGELCSNVGAANFPFQRVPGGTVTKGIVGPRALRVDDKFAYLVGDDKVAHRLTGNIAVPIGTDAISAAWQRYATISDASVFSFSFNGHRFIVFNFPTEAVTWVFDVNTGLWHERESWDENDRSLGRWRINCAIEAYGKVLVGDAFSGKIGYLDSKVYTEFGNTIRGELIAPPIHGDGKRVFMPALELDIESGVGLSSGQGSAPVVTLGISDDGGRTFDNPELFGEMGKTGEYRHRLRWDRLGSFEDSRILRVTITDPVPRTIIAARCPGLTVGT